jgi:hypothetical protein
MRISLQGLRRLESCPVSGTGVHLWLASTALSLAHLVDDPEKISQLLQTYSAGCGRFIPPLELHAAVSSALAIVRGSRFVALNGASSSPPPKWPRLHQGLIERIECKGFGVEELRRSSPVVFLFECSFHVLNRLFEENEWVCCASSPQLSATKKFDEWRDQLDQVRFVVPSPMRSEFGVTLEGRESMRCLDNVGNRRFLVIEFDSSPIDSQAGAIKFLSEYLPLVMVIHSGGKSLHSWYSGDADSEQLLKFMRLAVSLGADPATWSKCQLVRLPFGRRDNGNLQNVLYFDPSSL